MFGSWDWTCFFTWLKWIKVLSLDWDIHQRLQFYIFSFETSDWSIVNSLERLKNTGSLGRGKASNGNNMRQGWSIRSSFLHTQKTHLNASPNFAARTRCTQCWVHQLHALVFFPQIPRLKQSNFENVTNKYIITNKKWLDILGRFIRREF